MPVDAPDGREVLAVVAKATYEVGDDGRLSLPLEPARVRWSDVPADPEEEHPAPHYPSDLCPVKVGTDVLLVGHAQPPSPTSKMVVALRVLAGEEMRVDKAVDVYGPRSWTEGLRGVTPTSARPIERTPLSWHMTWGGVDERDGEVLLDDRNPAGRGVAFEPRSLVGHPVPPVEDREAPIGSRKPAPAGFGAVASSWQPRASRYGTCDQGWRRERFPLVPADFDLRFFSVAPDDQWCPEPLVGGETVEVVGVRGLPAWRFRLPTDRPVFVVRSEDEEASFEPHLDTVLIDADEGRIELSWRLAVPLPKKTERLEWIRIHYRNALEPSLVADLAQRKREAEASPSSH